ncbi:odorant receptor 46a [Nasonia vitripennis]|uniref:Odorant receptor n=1 Tax=Nasonia vitripennis TaxID=7425 RepID=A0A7M7QET8_NASVI|nr:odorant receptor 46a [Nasonia vitripennis]
MMRKLTFAFKVLSMCGVWLPVDWTSPRRIFYYKIFSCVVLIACYTIVTLQCLLLSVTEFDFSFIADILFTFLTSITVCTKTMNFIAKRPDVIRLADMLLLGCCLPRDKEEAAIQKQCDEFIRVFTIALNIMAQSTLACWLLIPLFQSPELRSLPFQIWLPYDTRGSRNFWITYAYEIWPMIMGVLVNATVDVVVSGFILQACAQLDILKYRLTRLPELVKQAEESNASLVSIRKFERTTLEMASRHHAHIIEYVRNVNETFNMIIVEQFFASSLILSVIIYALTKSNVNTLQYVMDVGYLLCMLAEFFSYCWFGNEITLKSTELGLDIYRIDWTLLSAEASRNLLFIMLRTSKPIVMSCGHFVVLNVESFKSILKVSYSAFNFLKESAD